MVWGPRRPEDTLCAGSQANPPELDQADNLASLVSVNESSVLNTLRHRYEAGLLHTWTGPDLIVLQPRGSPAPSAGKVSGDRGGRVVGTGAGRVGSGGSLCISGRAERPASLSVNSILPDMRFGHIAGRQGPCDPPALERTDSN